MWLDYLSFRSCLLVKVDHEAEARRNPWAEFFNWDNAATTFFLSEMMNGIASPPRPALSSN